MRGFFQELYDSYHTSLYQFIFYMVKEKELAEDLIQEVYIKVLKSYHTFKGDSSEKTWLFSIARHVVIDYFRKQSSKKSRIMEYFDFGEKGHIMKDNQPLPEEIALQNDEMKRIYQCLDLCTVDQKSVLVLRYIQSFSIQETADILGWSVSKVKTTQHRAIKALKVLLEEEGKEDNPNGSQRV
ncbi:RNA polymerase sigma factor SigX [Aquibacillus sp. 3ASR75-11]|uniref:RNA polymerase sigma factor n=1 Tax=Terrihalobacillus insolitus TaxID=2950438 RepID=A0A9X3WSU3_9BACI|nr:RNA polymerase sigma factor SigX [Terrihalobacillus insolitus]MDC3413088.1 RNA polymerase sigma factor SigX [Terrihalobacillus insolitus]MDC3424830.1 RNA polymerase sigma factor SigX [Terrihalobacillus insolitus]